MADKELKQKIKDQEAYIYGLQYEIQLLKHQLENFESLQREKCFECEKKSVVELADAEFKLMELKEKIERLIK